MKCKLLLSLCLIQMACACVAFASVDAGDSSVDDDQQINAQPVAAQITLTSDPEEIQIASNAKNVSTGGCHVITGIASIYGLNHGPGDGARQRLAGGGRLNTAKATAAMLPVYKVGNEKVKVRLHTFVEVTANGRTIKVLVNDRGPYAKGRKIDLTPAAAHGLGFSEKGAGLAHVQIRVGNCH